ncbi:hypothetical protein LY76DRAFT_42421 [Colletotrichum caudatum]|nr:hypothetical protein LY76DRAFT_42421 [Colletotrichum caudatum]
MGSELPAPVSSAVLLGPETDRRREREGEGALRHRHQHQLCPPISSLLLLIKSLHAVSRPSTSARQVCLPLCSVHTYQPDHGHQLLLLLLLSSRRSERAQQPGLFIFIFIVIGFLGATKLSSNAVLCHFISISFFFFFSFYHSLAQFRRLLFLFLFCFFVLFRFLVLSRLCPTFQG